MESNIYFLSTICHEEFSRSVAQGSNVGAEIPSSPSPPPSGSEHRRSSTSSNMSQSPLERRRSSINDEARDAALTRRPSYQHSYATAAARYRAELLPGFTVKYMSTSTIGVVPHESTTLKGGSSNPTGSKILASELMKNSRTIMKCMDKH